MKCQRPDVVATVRDTQVLNRFLEDLKQASKKSRRTGGGYSAFLPLDSGRRLQVDICLRR